MYDEDTINFNIDVLKSLDIPETIVLFLENTRKIWINIIETDHDYNNNKYRALKVQDEINVIFDQIEEIDRRLSNLDKCQPEIEKLEDMKAFLETNIKLKKQLLVNGNNLLQDFDIL